MDLTFSQSLIGGGSYEREDAPFSDFIEHVTSATVGQSSSLVGDSDDTSMAENDYTGQSDYLRATPEAGDGEWDEGQHSDEGDMNQQWDEIPLLYPILYGQLGFSIVDRPLECRLRLSSDRSGLGWPLRRWRGDETDLLVDETIDIGVALELDGLSSPTLWEVTTTNSQRSYSRCLYATDQSSSSYRFGALREPGTALSAASPIVGSPNTASEEEYVQEEDIVPLAYQLAGSDEANLCSDAPEDDVEEIRSSPQSKSITLNYQELGQITKAYQEQCSESASDYWQEPLEAKPGDLEMEGAMETEKTSRKDENNSGAQVRGIQEPVRGFVLAPDLFGD
jgi:hypothetical protein